ncbi:MAG: hypothetical protein R2817_15140 [Flavobacteriales bacterium]
MGLTDEFGLDEQKAKRWQYVPAEHMKTMPLITVIEALREFLLPVLAALSAGNGFDRQWRAGAGWNAA